MKLIRPGLSGAKAPLGFSENLGLGETTPSGELREEFKCAQFLDGLADIQFWIRNLPRRSTSFRLQTSGDWFYPDFLCQLADGRKLAVEYKGKQST